MAFVIKNVMAKEVVTFDSERTVEETSKIMAEQRKGYAVVLKAGRPAGMGDGEGLFGLSPFLFTSISESPIRSSLL